MKHVDGLIEMTGWKGAAEHIGSTESWLRNQVRCGRGPTFYKPSPKSIFFLISDIDAWRASWPKIEATRK
jgi:hypothetical protein